MWMLAILTFRLIPEELGTQFLWIVPERRKANPLSGVTSSDSTDTWRWKESGEPQRQLPSRLLRKSHLRNHQDRWTTTNTRLDMKNWIWATTRNSKLLLLFAKGLRTHFNKCRLRWRKLTAKLCRLVQGHLPFHIMIVFHKFVNFSGEMFLFSPTLKRCKTIRKLASASVSKTNESRSHVDTQIFHNHNFNFIYTETTIFSLF